MSGSTLPLALDAFSGRKMGKYEVLCRLSTGGMAEIFLASQRGLAGFRKLVVLKQILPDIAGEEEFVQMFLDEAKVTAAFNHPHIAQVFDLDVADGELFLAMEFVPGATLVEVAKACRAANEPIPIGLSLEAVRDTALALHYAHTFTDPLGRPSSVIHRDVAEKNIMVTYEGVTKLLDFGIAKNLARRGRTQIGMVKGTSGYMSPEQILGEQLDARSDLFSLGVVLHELLTGLRLFHSKTPEGGAGAILHGQVPPPSRSNKAVPPELDAVVLKTLARKREDRYASTLEFARALERAVGPLFWHPEQSAELIQRLFAERRDQTRQLLLTVRSMSGEISGVVNVAQFLPPVVPPKLPPEPATIASLPQITPSPPQAPRPSLPEMPAVKPVSPASQEAIPLPPPAPPAAPPPPTPPRGAITKRATGVNLPAITPAESAALRRAVFEPLPQKRGGGAGQSNEALSNPPSQESTARTQPGDEQSYNTGSGDWIPLPPAQENTGRTDPGNEPSHPGSPSWMPPSPREHTARTDPGNEPSYPGAASAAPSHEPDEHQDEDDSRPEVLTMRQEVPEEEEVAHDDRTRPIQALHLMGTILEDPRREVSTAREDLPQKSQPREEPPQEDLPLDDRTRPIRANLHMMATIPMLEGLAPPQDLPAEQEPAEDEDSTRQIRTTLSRVRPAFTDRPAGRVSNPSLRPLQRRVPTPQPPEPPAEEPPQIEFSTEPAHGPALADTEVADTNETPLPPPGSGFETDFEEGTLVNAPAAVVGGQGDKEGHKGGKLLVVLAVGVLLACALVTAVVLGLDGGRVMKLVSQGSPAQQGPVPGAQARPTLAAPQVVPTSASAPTGVPAAAAAPEPSASSPAAQGGSPEATAATADDTAPPPGVSAAAPSNSEPGDTSLEDAVMETTPPQASKKSRAASKPTAAPSGTGVLTLVTDPYAKVYLGRRYLGDTPLFKINLPAGKHSLRLVDADGRSLRLQVEIKSGETTKLNTRLDELPQQ